MRSRGDRGVGRAVDLRGEDRIPRAPVSQIGPKDWSGIVLLQYPSREAYDRHAQSEAFRAARARFGEVYVHGFRRSAVGSALIPQALLAMRAVQLLRGQPSHFPFRPWKGPEPSPKPSSWRRDFAPSGSSAPTPSSS